MEIKSTLKTLKGIGIKKNTIPMEMKSTMKTLMGIGLKVNSIPMEMKSTLKTLKVVEIDGKKYKLIKVN